MPFSMHVVRWMSLLTNANWDLHFFSSFPYAKPHAELPTLVFHDYFYNFSRKSNRNITYADHSGRKMVIKHEKLGKWVGKGYRFLGLQKKYQDSLLQLVREIKPDIIHSMESQHGGYMVTGVMDQLRKTGESPVWIHTTFGIDLDYFMHFPDHKEKLTEMFKGVDLYLAEGKRDVNYAQALGFKGKYDIFASAGGGYRMEDFAAWKNSRPSERKLIVVKGYQDSVRRGLVAMRAITRCKDILKGYEIFAYSCAKEVSDYIAYCNDKEGMDIKIFKETNYENWLQFLSNARVSITNNLSDGIPSSFFESMLMGAFPIQSKSSCTDEWIVNGKTGFLVEPEDPECIENAIRQAIQNDQLVDSAAMANHDMIAGQLEFEKVKMAVHLMYEQSLKKNQPTPSP